MATTPAKPRVSLTLAQEPEVVAVGGVASPPPRTSIRIVPGGAHDTWGGFADTPTSSAATKFHSSFRSMGAKVDVSPVAMPSPKEAPQSTTKAAFAVEGALPAPVPSVPPLPPQIATCEIGLTGATEGDLPPPKPVSAAKARDLMTTNVLCGEERPNVDAAAAPARPAPADAKAITAMTLPELRIALRSRGLSPAGARQTLIERLLAGLADAATEPLLLPTHDGPSGVGSNALGAVYARADGALSDGPVHRGAGPPAVDNDMGALLSDDAPPGPPEPSHSLSDAARANLASHIRMGEAEEDEAEGAAAEQQPGRKVDPRLLADMSGCGIFTPEAAPSAPWSALKAADYKGNGIFDETAPAPPRLPGVTQRPLPEKRVEMGSRIVFDGHVAGEGVEAPPAIGLSTAKSAELTGGDPLAAGASPLPTPPPMNARKAAELDSSVFDEPEEAPGGSGGSARRFGGPSPPNLTARARDFGSKCFSEEHTGPQPRPQLLPGTLERAADIHSKASAEGCTMVFAAPGDAPAATPPGRPRRVSGAGPSSIVFG